jgi:hypothetical protein
LLKVWSATSKLINMKSIDGWNSDTAPQQSTHRPILYKTSCAPQSSSNANGEKA